MDERAGSIQNKKCHIQAGGEGRSMSRPEEMDERAGSIQNKNATFRQEGKADQ